MANEAADQIKRLTRDRLEFDGINQAAISKNFWYEVSLGIDNSGRVIVLNDESLSDLRIKDEK